MTRDEVIKGLECCLEGLCDCCPYESSDGPGGCKDELMVDALSTLKDGGQDEGWLCAKQATGIQKRDLLCACGNKVYFTTLLFKGGYTVNELYCPNCGLTMRSPGTDKDGVWLQKQWEEVVTKAQEPRVLTLEEAKVVLKTEPVIWFEIIGEGIVAGLRMSGTDYFTMTTDEVMNEDTFDDDLVSKLYGIKFRMWSCKPTDAQRKVTPWVNGTTNG